MILLLGAKGSMGRRYQAILKYLGKPYIGLDLNDNPHFTKQEITGIIIATPTETHFNLIKKYASWGVPILCEKPITKNQHELDEILSLTGLKLQMVNQYEFLNIGKEKGKKTHYNYFRHGNDGIEWDCINIIGLSHSKTITLLEDSPVWTCVINGKKLHLSHMDKAYVEMVETWLKKPKNNLSYAKKAHLKVWKYQDSRCN